MKIPGFLLLFFVLAAACHKTQTTEQTRTYRMGFANSAPNYNYNSFQESLSLWTSKADAAIISVQVPWDSLLTGESSFQYIMTDYYNLAIYFREKGLKIWVYIDPEDGLDRSSDADDLLALGKSIAQPVAQSVYVEFVWEMDSLLKPDHLGLALETNLIRAAAPDSIYQGVKLAASQAASYLHQMDPERPLSISVQAEYAWGEANGGKYIGTAQDFADFPFITELGISSYPYFSFNSPSAIPTNYYSELTGGRSIPVFVSEGGWTSNSFISSSGQLISSPQIQAEYMDKQGQLLAQANAIAWFQLTFTDLEVSSYPPSTQNELQYFAWLGMVDTSFQAKPAYASWDSLFSKKLVN